MDPAVRSKLADEVVDGMRSESELREVSTERFRLTPIALPPCASSINGVEAEKMVELTLNEGGLFTACAERKINVSPCSSHSSGTYVDIS
jgi:hypothetical protein